MADYYVEVYQKNRSTSHIVSATHPDQVVRGLLHELPNGMFRIYIINKDGFGWNYLLTKGQGTPKARVINKLYNPLNKDEVEMIFGGNKKLEEVFK